MNFVIAHPKSKILLCALVLSSQAAAQQTTETPPRDLLLYLGQFDSDDEQLLELIDHEGELLLTTNQDALDKDARNRAQRDLPKIEMQVKPNE
jgi:hypothetical protein